MEQHSKHGVRTQGGVPPHPSPGEGSVGPAARVDAGRSTGEDPTPVVSSAGDDRKRSRPGVSMVIVTYNSGSTIERCLESLVRFTGPQDEIIVIDNASRDDTAGAVAAYEGRLPGSLHFVASPRNVGFSRGTNLGLQKATRDFVLLLNPDVEATDGWLERMVAHLERDPQVGAVGPTSDYVAGLQKIEHYLDPSPHQDADSIAASLAAQRPGLARETPLLIGFCLLMRRARLQAMGGLDPELFLGSDDLDLSLRLRQEGYRLLVATDVFVRHFGHVSFKTESSVKGEYLTRQSVNLLYEKLYRNFGGQVPASRDLWGMDWFQPQTGLTSIVILIHNNMALTRQCIESVYLHTHREFELILVDNGSSEDVAGYVAELLKSRGNVVFIRNDENEGYAYGSNQGLAAARGEFVVALNNDVIVTAGWLSKQLALLSLDAKVGMVGPRTNYTAGPQIVEGVPYTDIEGMYRFAEEWFEEHAGDVAALPRVTGLCMVMRRELLETVGGFDTTFGIGNFEDDDLCLRVQRAGFHILVANDVFIHHHGSATFRTMRVDYAALMEDNFRIFRSKWAFEGESRDGYNPQQLIKARAFDPAWDRIPAEYSRVFHPGAPPLQIGELNPVRLLCIPDAVDPAWEEVLAAYLVAFDASDPTSLVLRVEPPLPERIEEVVRAAERRLQSVRLGEGAAPDVVIEASALASQARGGLYTLATDFVPAAGRRAYLYAREARACGLPFVEAPTVETLRDLLALRRRAGEIRETAAVAVAG